MNGKKEIINLGIRLLIITAIAGLILSGVYNITKKPIKIEQGKLKNKAMQELISNADKFVNLNKTSNNIVEVNKALKQNKPIGYAIKVLSKGYSGNIELMVGISTNGKVTGIKVLSHSETPGLGAKANDPDFSNQYKNKSIDSSLEVVKGSSSKNNQIEAITGATITSKAVTKGVNEVIDFYKSNLEGGQK